MKRLQKNLVRHGLTLIELVVVMAILISLAAIILPRLDFVKGQADNAATATNAADLSKVIETNRVNSGSYGAFDLLGDGNGVCCPRCGARTSLPDRERPRLQDIRAPRFPDRPVRPVRFTINRSSTPGSMASSTARPRRTPATATSRRPAAPSWST